METVAYLRVSTGSQNFDNQKLAILDYARQKQLAVDRFVEVQASSRKGPGPRRTDELLDSLIAGDHLIVSELSRLGRTPFPLVNSAPLRIGPERSRARSGGADP